jgi:hypothetical protein
VGKRSRRQLPAIPEQGRDMWDLGVCRVLGRQITIIGRTTMTTDAAKTAIRAVITAIHKGLRDGDAAAVTALEGAGRAPGARARHHRER